MVGIQAFVRVRALRRTFAPFGPHAKAPTTRILCKVNVPVLILLTFGGDTVESNSCTEPCKHTRDVHSTGSNVKLNSAARNSGATLINAINRLSNIMYEPVTSLLTVDSHCFNNGKVRQNMCMYRLVV